MQSFGEQNQHAYMMNCHADLVTRSLGISSIDQCYHSSAHYVCGKLYQEHSTNVYVRQVLLITLQQVVYVVRNSSNILILL